MSTFFFAELTPPSANIWIILPELIVALAGTIVMLFDSFVPNRRTITGTVSMIGLIAAALELASNDPFANLME